MQYYNSTCNVLLANFLKLCKYEFDLRKCVHVLYECRRFLMHSYAFIFFVLEDNMVYLIETNLDDLEANSDKLSVYLEEYLKRTCDDQRFKDEADMRVKIIDCAV